MQGMPQAPHERNGIAFSPWAHKNTASKGGKNARQYSSKGCIQALAQKHSLVGQMTRAGQGERRTEISSGL